jgi:two-component system, NarL family, nitrate/nitrite response regulator NarL
MEYTLSKSVDSLRRQMVTHILIADRQNMFREVLRNLLELQPDFTVVGDTDDGEQLVKLAAELKPDILLFDVNLAKMSGAEALQKILALHMGIHAILLTDAVGHNTIAHALVWGAHGIVRKGDPTHLLFKSIRSVMNGQYWINHGEVAEIVMSLRSLTALVEQKAQQQAQNLSRQQQKIIEAIVEGCSNRDIAQEMSLSERTVKYHLTQIFQKLGVSGRMELARYSLKNNVVREA